MISALSRHCSRTAVIGAVTALLLVPGLLTVNAAAVAGPASPVRVTPSKLALGAEPRPGWISWAHGDQLDDELRRAGARPVSLGMPGASAQSIREVGTGWLVDYLVWDRPLTAPHRLVLVRRDGTKRVVAQRTDQVQIVSGDGAAYVTKREIYDRKHRRTATVLSALRVKDGRVTDRLRIAGSDSVRARVMRDDVILDRVAQAAKGGAHRVTTIRWRPATGRVATLWRRTAHRTDGVGLGKLGHHEIVVPDKRKGQGQTVADVGTRRQLWRLPVREHALRFGHGVLLTMTQKAGPEDVRTLRARQARTGRLLATYRGTIFDSYVRWETARTFVIMAADGLEPAEGGGSTWANPSLVRCSTGAAGCQRVDADLTTTSISIEPGTPG